VLEELTRLLIADRAVHLTSGLSPGLARCAFRRGRADKGRGPRPSL